MSTIPFLLDAAQLVHDPELMADIVRETQSWVLKLRPGSMFSSWSPPPVTAETVLPRDAIARIVVLDRAGGTSRRKHGNAEALVDGDAATFWAGIMAPGSAQVVVQVTLASPQPLSSVHLHWHNGASPKRAMCVQVSVMREGDTDFGPRITKADALPDVPVTAVSVQHPPAHIRCRVVV